MGSEYGRRPGGTRVWMSTGRHTDGFQLDPLPESSGLKHWNEAHEAIARRTRIDRVRFDDRSAAASCELHGSGNDALTHALAAQASNNEKAGNRPDAFVIPAMFDESTVG